VLCSDCHQPIKPVVAIDVDGTLGDYHSHFLRFASDWIGEGHAHDPAMYDYTGYPPFKKWFKGYFGVGDKEWHEIKLAYRQGGMKRTMPVFNGAQALCWAVRNAGAELWITTTRPYLSLDNIVPDTVEWCRRREIAYDGMLFDEDKYQQLATRVDPRRVVAVLDDLPEMYDAAEQTFSAHPYSYHVPILVMGRYNSVVRRQMMADLRTCADIVVSRINWWKEEYHA
jgi:hypothetical protein